MSFLKSKQGSLNPDDQMKVAALFKKRGWDVTGELFRRYCKRMAMLNTDAGKDLFLELAEKFTHIPLSSYLDRILPPLKLLLSRVNPTNGSLIMMTASSPEEMPKTKSGNVVAYLLRGTWLKHRLAADAVLPYLVDDENSLSRIPDLGNKHLVLVDDFIGTGETAENKFLYLSAWLYGHGLPMPECSVLYIAAMEQGVNRMRGLGVPVYAGTVFNRGLTDNYRGGKLADRVSAMRDIETSLKVKSGYRFGYMQSEALVCMERCPNNTFPVFWYKKNAPYER